jgi:hypothetical protein
MRKLTDEDLKNIAGTTVQGYHVEGVRVKRGKLSDSDHYGIILGRSADGNYVTWQFHLDENEEISVYWGHYYIENREGAVWDFENRGTDSSGKFGVTITETLKLTVEVEATDQQEAERIVSDGWRGGEYVLGAENFVGVEFEVVAT